MPIKIQAVMDESYANEEFVIAGHIATAENWVKFVPEWEALLPHATQGKDGTFRFKMSEMTSPERMERVRMFYEVIEKYVALSLAVRVNMEEWRRACRRVTVMLNGLGWRVENLGKIENKIYSVVFLLFMENFHHQRDEIGKLIDLRDPVDFIFDDGVKEQKSIYEGWSEFLENTPDERRKQYGSHPRFENDQKFKPLQAADLWAWWVRNWYEEDNSELPTKMCQLDFGNWKGKRRYTIVFPISEEHIFEYMLSYCRGQLEAHLNRPIVGEDE